MLKIEQLQRAKNQMVNWQFEGNIPQNTPGEYHIGVRFTGSNTWHWFITYDGMNPGAEYHFSHSYSANTGKTQKGYARAQKVERAILDAASGERALYNKLHHYSDEEVILHYTNALAACVIYRKQEQGAKIMSDGEALKKASKLYIQAAEDMSQAADYLALRGIPYPRTRLELQIRPPKDLPIGSFAHYCDVTRFLF